MLISIIFGILMFLGAWNWIFSITERDDAARYSRQTYALALIIVGQLLKIYALMLGR